MCQTVDINIDFFRYLSIHFDLFVYFSPFFHFKTFFGANIQRSREIEMRRHKIYLLNNEKSRILGGNIEEYMKDLIITLFSSIFVDFLSYFYMKTFIICLFSDIFLKNSQFLCHFWKLGLISYHFRPFWASYDQY